MAEDNKEILNKLNSEKKPEFVDNGAVEENLDNIGRFEKVDTPELVIEKPEDDLEDIVDMKEGELGGIISVGQQRKISAQRAKDIEKILEKGLDEVYLAMPPEKRAEFKSAGERTIARINDLIQAGKASMKIVIDLIRSWLSIIPGVNKFFLEQEAKIKADEILGLSKKDL